MAHGVLRELADSSAEALLAFGRYTLFAGRLAAETPREILDTPRVPGFRVLRISRIGPTEWLASDGSKSIGPGWSALVVVFIHRLSKPA